MCFLVFLSTAGPKTVTQIVFSHQAKQHAKMIFSQNKPPNKENEKTKTVGDFFSSSAFHCRFARLLVPEIDDGRVGAKSQQIFSETPVATCRLRVASTCTSTATKVLL